MRGCNVGEEQGPPSGFSLEQYNNIIEDTAKLSDRRQTVNNLYLSANSLLLGGVALLAQQSGITGALSAILVVLISVVGLVLCFDWSRLIETYRALNAVRFSVLMEMEDRAEFKRTGYVPIYHKEDALYQVEERKKTGEKPLFGFSRIEKNLPVTFRIFYIIVAVGTVVLQLVVRWGDIAAQFAHWGIALPH